MAVFMAFSFSMSNGVVLNMQCQLDPVKRMPVGRQARRTPHRPAIRPAMTNWRPRRSRRAGQHGLTMELTILFFMAVLLPLGSKELVQPDWDLEWLVTMPVERSTLVWGRVLERSASNVTGMFALVPAYGRDRLAFRLCLERTADRAAGRRRPAAAGVIAAYADDTGLRMWLPASQLRNLQALTGLFNLPLIYFVMALGLPQASSFPMEWARDFPSWVSWTPPGLALQAIQAQGPGQLLERQPAAGTNRADMLWGGLRCCATSCATAWSTPARARASSASRCRPENQAAKGGLLSSAAVLAAVAHQAPRAAPAGPRPQLPVPDPAAAGDYRRQPDGLQRQADSLSELGEHHTLAAAIAFGIGVYVLMLSAFQTLNNEGKVLWLLYTVPRSSKAC
jgi:ABC-2 type transport system permease protein